MSVKPQDENDTMELSIWGGGWGLPSIDPESIQALASFRFGGVPGKVTECNNPWRSPTGSIPFFKHGTISSKTLFSASEIATYLRSKNYNSDYGLTSKQCAEVVAYSQYINEALRPALQYYCWMQESNYIDVVRPFYGRRLPWVYKMWYPDRLRKQAASLIAITYPESELHPEVCEPYILQKAQICILYLSAKLGTNEFFINPNSPTTIDAVIFSFLAPFLKVPLPYNPIKEYIKSTSNLERYVARISLRYFPPAAGKGDKTRNSSSTTSVIYGVDGEVVSSDDTGYSLKQKCLTIFAAVFAMLAYAYRNGIIRLPINPALEAEEEEEYWEDN